MNQNEKKKRVRGLCRIAGVLAMLLFCVGCHSRGDTLEIQIREGAEEETLFEETRDENRETERQSQEVWKETACREIFVHICGEVAAPGLYALEEGARVWDGVAAAGGFTLEADQNAVNLATILTDGMKILIPGKQEGEDLKWIEEPQEGNSGEKTQKKETHLININKASVEELTELPGIGETRAKAIVAYRESAGRFYAIEEIQKVSGIKAGLFEKIKDYITVGG